MLTQWEVRSQERLLRQNDEIIKNQKEIIELLKQIAKKKTQPLRKLNNFKGCQYHNNLLNLSKEEKQMKITELFANIRSTSGTADKAAVLSANFSDTVKQILSDTYTTARYFVKKFNTDLPTGNRTLDSDYALVHKLLTDLAARNLTGNDATSAVENLISQFEAADQEVVINILDRNLKIGLSKDTIRKLDGDTLEEKFEVTLAKNIENVKGVNQLDGTYYASRKCDGVRCIGFISKQNSKVEITFKSRQNKIFTTLHNLKAGLTWYVRDLPDGEYITDGEMCKVDENGDEDFAAIMKEVRRKNYTIPDPCYQMFDFCTKDEWDGKTTSPVFTERLVAMKKRMEGNTFKTIKLLEQELVTSKEIYDKWIKRATDGNWEGIMLRKDVPFLRGRTSNLLKVKPFEDDEFEVFDIDVGEMTTSLPGQGNITYTGVRAILIKEYHGGVVHVGSGLTRDQRIDWYEHPEHIIGKKVCVKWQKGGNTQSQSGEWSLRLPILKWVYEGNREV